MAVVEEVVVTALDIVYLSLTPINTNTKNMDHLIDCLFVDKDSKFNKKVN